MNPIKRLTHRAEIRAVARLLHLSNFLELCYYRWASPRRIVELRVLGVEAKFYVPDPRVLRVVEGNLLREDDFLRVLIPSLRQGDVFWDIGSQFGQFALLLAKVVGPSGQVVAFEPESGAYSLLKANLEINGLGNVRAFGSALGDHNGRGYLFTEKRSPSLVPDLSVPGLESGFKAESLLNTEAATFASSAEPDDANQIVDVARGDWIREKEQLPIPRALKIDVEGYEYFVLKGLNGTLAHPACELLCCEIHPELSPRGAKTDAVIGLVKSLGFTRLNAVPRWGQLYMTAWK
jgi:FkbM family methyltransferase